MNKKILIIGPSGSGKTYISSALRKQGINAVDADLIPGLSGWFDGKGKEVKYPDNADKEFLGNHEFLWNKEFLKEYLSKQNDIYIFGLSGNIFSTIDLFGRVYFLEVSPDNLRTNLRHKSRKNPMGKTDCQLKNALKYAEEIKEQAKKLGLKIIDATDKTPENFFKIISHC
jgi:shikimate kinase